MHQHPRTARQGARPASRAAGRPNPIEVLRQALSLPLDALVDETLHFGVRASTTVVAMETAPQRLLVLAELAPTRHLQASDWVQLAQAWSRQFDGDFTGRPVVLDDTLWLSINLGTRCAEAEWVGRVRRFLLWASEVRALAQTEPDAVH